MPPLPAPELIETALARFRDLTGLKATLEVVQQGRTHEPDGRIRITQGPQHWRFDVTCKARADRLVTLHQVQAQVLDFTEDGLFIAPYLAPELARQCQAMGLPFMDAAGNAYVKQEGLFVLVTGQKPDRALVRAERPMRAFDRTGLRLVFTLLTNPDLLKAPYRDLAKAAGVALGTVGHVLTDLREHGFLVEEGRGGRRWIDRDRAVQAWVTNYPLRLRERLRVRRFAAKDPDWWKAADPAAFGGCWGGEVAAAKLMGDLIPNTVTVYLPEDRIAFLAKHRLRADPQGPIEVLDTFWTLPPAQDIPRDLAPPLLIYADLQTLGDPRTLEAARRIHEHHLA